MRQFWMYVNATNDVIAKYGRANAATADGDQMINAPSGLTITKIDDDWMEITALPTANPAIYPAGTAYRDWYAFRLADTISEVTV